MTRLIHVYVCVMLAVLWLPVNGIAGEAATTIEKSTGTSEAGSRTSSKSKTGSLSQGKATKKSDQKDMQSRGLFSKKKKKKPVGGAAGHAESSSQEDLPSHSRSVEGK